MFVFLAQFCIQVQQQFIMRLMQDMIDIYFSNKKNCQNISWEFVLLEETSWINLSLAVFAVSNLEGLFLISPQKSTVTHMFEYTYQMFPYCRKEINERSWIVSISDNLILAESAFWLLKDMFICVYLKFNHKQDGISNQLYSRGVPNKGLDFVGIIMPYKVKA